MQSLFCLLLLLLLLHLLLLFKHVEYLAQTDKKNQTAHTHYCEEFMTAINKREETHTNY